MKTNKTLFFLAQKEFKEIYIFIKKNLKYYGEAVAATTLSIMAFSITILSVMTQNITLLSIRMLSTMAQII
jgi:hypothetical protein